MNRIIKSMEDKYLQTSLEMINKTFTDSESVEDAQIVVNLVKEIRLKSFYVPKLELIMVNEKDEVIGYAMFSKIHLVF